MNTTENMKFKVGDKVTFEVKGVTYEDIITYIDSSTIEGKKYDLTNQKIKKS